MKEKLIDYVKFTLQTQNVTHRSIVDFMGQQGHERGLQAAFMIANRAVDLALEEGVSPQP